MIYETNKCTEYAMKDSEGNELSKVNSVESVPEVTEDNLADILNKQPKFIVYSGVVFVLQDTGELPLRAYYSSIFGTSGETLTITNDGEEITMEHASAELALQSDIPTETGTKLYKHNLRKGGGTVQYISADPTPKSLNNVIRITSIEPTGEFVYDGIIATANIRSVGPVFLSYISTNMAYNSDIDITTFWNGATDTVTPL